MGIPMPIAPIQAIRLTITAGQTYRCTVSGPQVNAATLRCYSPLLEWLPPLSPQAPTSSRPEPFPLERHYLTWTGQGWSGTFTAPKQASDARLVLYHWPQLAAAQAVNWKLSIEPTDEIPATQTFVAAVAHQQVGPDATIQKNIDLCVNAIRQAGRQGVKLLVLSENIIDRGVPGPVDERAMSLDDPRLSPIHQAVKENGLHLIFGLHEKTPDGRHCVTAVLIGPDGQRIGHYHKTMLAQAELEDGFSPASEPMSKRQLVFDTQLGRIGMLICFDLYYPETAIELARQGAQIIGYPVAGSDIPGHWDASWRARAVDQQVYFLASITHNCGGQAQSRIIAPDGSVLASSRLPNTLVSATLEIPFRMPILWFSTGPCHSDMNNVVTHSRQLLGPCR